jgi:hypothetical protein
VITYLWAKGLGAGALFIAALAVLLDIDLGAVGDLAAPLIAAAAAAATGGLLVWDLKRPERFYLLFTHPNHRSWLVLGGYALLGFGVAAFAWFLTAVLGASGAQLWLAVPVCLASALAAGYTAFLFGQAEGRDLWQSKWLLPHLLAQAAMTGAGALAIVAVLADTGQDAIALLARTLAVAALLHLAITGLDLCGRHVSRRAAVAARTLVRGRYQTALWWGAVAPTAVAVILAVLAWTGDRGWAVLVAGLVVQGALLTYETIYVRAGQDVPLS